MGVYVPSMGSHGGYSVSLVEGHGGCVGHQ